MQTPRKRHQHELDGSQDEITAKRFAPGRFEGDSHGTLTPSSASDLELPGEIGGYSPIRAISVTDALDVPMTDAQPAPEYSDLVCYGAVGFIQPPAPFKLWNINLQTALAIALQLKSPGLIKRTTKTECIVGRSSHVWSRSS